MILDLAEQLYRAIPGSYRPMIAACLRVISTYLHTHVSITTVKELEEAIKNWPLEVLELFAYSVVGRKHHRSCLEKIFDHLLNGQQAAAVAGGGEAEAAPVVVGGRLPNARPTRVMDAEGQMYAIAVEKGLRTGEEVFRDILDELLQVTATEGESPESRLVEEIRERLEKTRAAAVRYYDTLDNPKKGIVKIFEAIGTRPRFLKVSGKELYKLTNFFPSPFFRSALEGTLQEQATPPSTYPDSARQWLRCLDRGGGHGQPDAYGRRGGRGWGLMDMSAAPVRRCPCQ